MVGHERSSNTPKRRWLRFRFRFGLRTLLLFTAAVAVLLSLEAKRARDQNELSARLAVLGGSCQRAPRAWIPQSVRQALSEDMGSSITTVSLRVMLAPTTRMFLSAKLATPKEVEEFLTLPALNRVRNMDLYGTAVTDEALDELAGLRSLERVAFWHTAVTELSVGLWQIRRSDCAVQYSRSSNGQREIAACHRVALEVTADLNLFLRADRGDVEAIERLLRILRGSRGAHRYLIAAFFRRIEKEPALPLFIEAFQTGNSQIRQDMAILLAEHEQFDMLAQALDDPDIAVRLKVVTVLARVAARKHLLVAIENSEAEVRTAAIRAVIPFVRHEGMPKYLEALQDPDAKVRHTAACAIEGFPNARAVEPLIAVLAGDEPFVRSQAARTLGKIADPRAIAPLESAAANDEDPYVRKAATKALTTLRQHSESP